MKSLIKLVSILVIVAFLSACGSDNKTSRSSSSSSSNSAPSDLVDSNLKSFWSRVNSMDFVATPSSNSGVSYEFNDLDNDPYFIRERSSNGSVYREDDSLTSREAVRNYLLDLIEATQQYRQGCGLMSYYGYQAYYNIFGRQYKESDCFVLAGSSYNSNTIYYVDLNYPIEANPVAKVRTSVSMKESDWWIFTGYSYDYDTDGYYLHTVRNYSYNGFY